VAGSAPNPRGLLRRLAALLIRGPEAPFILADLDELLERDIEQGMAGARAHSRYLRNAVASAYSVARRRTRTRISFGVSWLDVKLSVRMLVKHPGLTAVAVFALAIAIPIGFAPLQLWNSFKTPLPFEDGHEILGIQTWGLDAYVDGARQ
jgi:hypothetical protein